MNPILLDPNTSNSSPQPKWQTNQHSNMANTVPATTIHRFLALPVELKRPIWEQAAAALPTIHVCNFNFDLGTSLPDDDDNNDESAPPRQDCACMTAHFRPSFIIRVLPNVTTAAAIAAACRPHMALLTTCRLARKTTILFLAGPLLGRTKYAHIPLRQDRRAFSPPLLPSSGTRHPMFVDMNSGRELLATKLTFEFVTEYFRTSVWMVAETQARQDPWQQLRPSGQCKSA